MSESDRPMSEREIAAWKRYTAAQHAMQTGVQIDVVKGAENLKPKFLRVGINTALRDGSCLVKLLVEKGLITREEYAEAMADGMEEEASGYEALHGVKLG